ncbi:hypothetical protein GGI05_004242, partial [Coemansia sp. RSA 2603]
LPPDLLRLFTPRPPPPYAVPTDCAPDARPRPRIAGIAGYLAQLQAAPRVEPTETPQQRKARVKAERAAHARAAISRAMATWDPALNLNATEDPYKTIIVARLHYDVTEQILRDEFGRFGPIVAVKMVNDMDANFRGYAFIEFERESDMRDAFRAADATRILGRRIVVDVERGRTVNGWLPRRFGAGLGATRRGDKSQNQPAPGRFDPAMPSVARFASSRPRSSSRSALSSHDRRDRPRDRDRERDRDRDRDRDRGRDRHRDYDYDYDKYRDRDRDRDRDRRDYRRKSRSRSPSPRPARRDRDRDYDRDRATTGSSHYSRRY